MFGYLKYKAAFILENARCGALPQSFMSCITAICLALNSEHFSLFNALLAVPGVLSAHLSANIFDDYFDYIMDKVEIRNKVKGARGLKCVNILNNRATINDFLLWAISFGIIAAIIGIYFIFTVGSSVIYFIFAGAFFAIFYSAPPFKLSYHGLGEFTIGLMFGPLLICGVYYVATGTLSLPVLLISTATGLLVLNIVYVHSISDIEADKACGKNTLAIILGNDYLRFFALFLFTIIPYIIVFCVSVLLGLFILITIPAAVYLLYVMRDKNRHKCLIILIPRKYWRRIIKAGNEYFYTRWLLSRNIMVVFTGIICLYCIFEAFLR